MCYNDSPVSVAMSTPESGAAVPSTVPVFCHVRANDLQARLSALQAENEQLRRQRDCLTDQVAVLQAANLEANQRTMLYAEGLRCVREAVNAAQRDVSAMLTGKDAQIREKGKGNHGNRRASVDP